MSALPSRPLPSKRVLGRLFFRRFVSPATGVRPLRSVARDHLGVCPCPRHAVLRVPLAALRRPRLAERLRETIPELRALRGHARPPRGRLREVRSAELPALQGSPLTVSDGARVFVRAVSLCERGALRKLGPLARTNRVREELRRVVDLLRAQANERIERVFPGAHRDDGA